MDYKIKTIKDSAKDIDSRRLVLNPLLTGRTEKTKQFDDDKVGPVSSSLS